MSTLSKSSKIINKKILGADCTAYFVGYDLNDDGEMEYRLGKLVKLLVNLIPEFAFGYHLGGSTPNDEMVEKIANAAKSIYKITEFKEVADLYLANGELDDDIEVDKKYLKRGEFGELILHLILRDFHSTVPLISKIYFKDSFGHAVHGFDSIHIHEESKTLWLGESKLYSDGKKGVEALVCDLKEHFHRDYLNDEFNIIANRIKDSHNEKQMYWLDLLDSSTTLKDQLSQIVIPMICTYTCEVFENHNDETDANFILDLETEIASLKNHFDKKNDHPLRDKLNIVLILFPVLSKNELVKKMHQKLTIMQKLGD